MNKVDRTLKKKKKKSRNILLKLAVLIFIIYVFFGLINQQNNMKEKQKELKNIETALSIQKAENAELRDMLVLTDDEISVYIEEKAKEKLNYVDPAERVFIGVPGS